MFLLGSGDALRGLFSNAIIVNTDQLVHELHVCQNINEMSCIDKAAEIIDNSSREVPEAARSGWAELGIVSLFAV